MAEFGYATLVPVSQNGLPVERATYVQNSAALVNVALFDTTSAPYTPTTCQYRIDDVCTGQPLVSWTATPLDPSFTIMIDSQQNRMVSFTQAFEVHQLMLQIVDASGNPFYEKVKFNVVRAVEPQSVQADQ